MAVIYNIKNFDARIQVLSTMDIAGNGQPGDLIQCFADVKDRLDPFADALKVAQVFKDVAGLIILDISTRNYTTIMDDLETTTDRDPVSNWLFIRAFKQLGFKKAIECSKEELDHVYKKHHSEIATLARIEDFDDRVQYLSTLDIENESKMDSIS